MSRQELKAFMEKKGLNEVDIASALKIHPITVSRYLDGKKVQRIIEDGFRRLVSEGSNPSGGPKSAA